MAICEACNRDMTIADGCAMGHVVIGGKLYGRIKRGAKLDLLPGYGRCHECGAKRGQFHHAGCDSETCPACGGQLIGCNCNVGDFVL